MLLSLFDTTSLYQMVISISSFHDHMYEILDMHIIHAWSYVQSSTVLSGLQLLRPIPNTQTHSYTQSYTSKCASTLTLCKDSRLFPFRL